MTLCCGKKTDHHHCPVCGFELSFKPWDGESASLEICPSCGIHFGYDDDRLVEGRLISRHEAYDAWREGWISRGMPWYSASTPPPTHWDPAVQVEVALRVRDTSA
jgi:hypothetical protein